MEAPTSRSVGVEPGQPGEPRFVERNLPLLRPGEHELRVRVEAVSVNPVDTKVAARVDSFRVLGFDAAGVVTEVGSRVNDFEPGDRVYYAGSLLRPGSNQSLHLVDERIVAHAPASLTAAQAASIPLAAITAWEALFNKLRLRADAAGTLLVVGAAGGVGSLLIQLVKTLLPGVSVIATASRPETATWALEIGADQVVNHRADLVAQVLAIAPGGVDWIFSAQSEGRLADYAELIQPFGEIVGIDVAPGDITPLKAKSASWHWEYMFTRADPTTAHGDGHRQILTAVAALVDEGRVRSTERTVISGLSVDSLAAAHRLVVGGSAIGKIVITLD